ncbi:MAG TPA: PfkB family carbohydrate kinase [Methylomirabilota bacterium]|nr:PfkB family carbohydrate kinase [Methylomirabilota bacterium]
MHLVQPEEFREQTAVKLLAAVGPASRLHAFVGLDGFVDEIVHVVDKRDNAESYHRLPTIASFAERIAAAAGKSTNVELVNQRIKLGGNGPIMANALARLGVRVTYVGALGYPTLHPVFNEFARHAEVYSIAEPGHTDALEFGDGKVMLTKSTSLNDITWANLQARFGRDRFIEKFSTADLVAFVNWTMIPYMSDLWASLLAEFCPSGAPTRRKIFFDLADPQKRTPADITRALELIRQFERYFEVILGLNEKEAHEVGEVLGLSTANRTRDGLCELSQQIQKRVPVSTLVVHPVSFALATGQGTVAVVDGPFVERPLITTGAGDHFNSGFCLGRLLGFDLAASLLTGVTTSGYYVRQAQSPGIEDLVGLLRAWPE